MKNCKKHWMEELWISVVSMACFSEMAAEGIWLPSVQGGHYVLLRVQMPNEFLQLPALDMLSFIFAKGYMWSLFLELEAGRPGRAEGNQSGDTDFNAVQHPKQLDSPLLKSLFRPDTMEKINFKRSGESRNKRNDAVIFVQKGRENQVSLHPTWNTDCLIAIQWGTSSGRLIILFKCIPHGCLYCKKGATK